MVREHRARIVMFITKIVNIVRYRLAA